MTRRVPIPAPIHLKKESKSSCPRFFIYFDFYADYLYLRYSHSYISPGNGVKMKKVNLLFSFLISSIASVAQQVQDSTKTIQLGELVISASRLQESISKSPVSIEKLSQKAIQQSAAPSFFDALENVKGVQMITPSLGFKVINTRGFANTTNVRFVQLVDGMDNQAPHIGAPIANALGPSDLDIESAEIIPGVASALYGMNAINGLANFMTKDPFLTIGLSVQQKTGFNRAGSSDGAKPYSETSIRWAQVIRSRFAYKINGTLMRGMDWIASDAADQNPTANASTGLLGADNPAADPINSYGNESSDRKTISLQGKNYVVARTGYAEHDVVDYSLRNTKGDATLSYAFQTDTKLSYTYRIADLGNVYQRANRFRLDHYQLQQHGLAFQSKSIQLRTYINVENTGNSYNARSMAENIDRTFKPDTQWYSDYTNRYQNAIDVGSSVADAHRLARQAADAGRPEPGTEDFQNLINQLRNINNWDVGAALRVKSRMLHSEGQINLTQKLLGTLRERTGVGLLLGYDHRTYIIFPDGNYFINPVEPGKNLAYGKTGGFIQVSKSLMADKLKIGATLRVDKNDYFSLKWNPRITAVYSPAADHNVRFSYQNGYRFPSIFEAFSNVNSGGVKRVGGLSVMSNGIFENAYLRTSIDAFQAAVNNDVNKQGLTKNAAIIKNQGLLAKNNYSYMQPEHIRSFELGYKGLILAQNVQLDVDFYYNKYTQFIAQVEMNVPKSSLPDSLAFYLNDKQMQERYRMWTNSQTTAYNYGSSIGLRYRFVRNFQVAGNVSYSRLDRRSSGDGLEDGFNTPRWITNLSLGNDKIYRTLGFMMTYRWQTGYYWQSFLVNGNVPAYQTVDAQVSCQWNKVKLKVGGTNILNVYYRSFLGGPSIGGLYYSSLTVNL
jgi:iron complex outermembrane receptor protein